MDILNKMSEDFDHYLNEYLEDLPKSPKKLYEAIRYVLSAPAKRFRPLATMLGCYVYDDNYEKALPSALAIEIFHNFTLVHDDIMDRAKIRRGLPTVHVKYDQDTAIMVGDVMMIHAIRSLLFLEEEVNLDLILDYFTNISVSICEGQVFDMEFEKRDRVSSEEYLEMIGLKTAVLLGLAFQSGALTAGVEETESQHLFEFGYSLGLAFQIMDDWIDAFGQESKTGKVKGGDIRQKKKTWLWIIAMENAEDEDRAFMESIMQGDEVTNAQLDRVLQLYHLYDISGIALSFADDLLSNAKEKIQQSEIPEEKAVLLIQLADKLVRREK